MNQTTYTLTIENIIFETEDAFTVYFKNSGQPDFQYKSGQHMIIKVNIDGKPNYRAYSFTSSPVNDDKLSITIKAIKNGAISNYLKNSLKVGQTIEVMPPEGQFTIYLNPQNKDHYILLAAGSGITPLFSILKSVLSEEPKSKVTLFYGNRHEKSIIFKDQLDQLSQQFKEKLKVTHILSQPNEGWNGLTGRLNSQKTSQLVEELLEVNDGLNQSYWICGPGEMINEVHGAISNLAIPQNRIHREFFGPPPESKVKQDSSSEKKSIEIKMILTSQEHKLTISGNQTILEAAINADIDTPFACQSGMCGSCKAKLKSGKVSMDSTEALLKKEINNGFILTCQSHPLTEDVIVSYDT